MRRVRPGIDDELLDLARRAAGVRAGLDAAARRVSRPAAGGGAALEVRRTAVAALDDAGRRALWPAIAARAGVVLDRRGTLRVAAFTSSGREGGRIQLSGGIEVTRRGDLLVVRRSSASPRASPAPASQLGREFLIK